MALTPEQQAQIDAQNAAQAEMERQRHQNQLELQLKQARLEALRLAKEVLLENARSKPVAEREVTAEQIAAEADKLFSYVNQ